MGAGPAHAVYFGVYEAVKVKLGGDNVDHTHLPLVSAAAGASATITSDALMNPFDVTKQRMQLNSSHRYASTFAVWLIFTERKAFLLFTCRILQP